MLLFLWWFFIQIVDKIVIYVDIQRKSVDIIRIYVDILYKSVDIIKICVDIPKK